MKRDRFRPKWVHFEILEIIRLPVQPRFSLIELLTVIVVKGILAGNSAWGATPGDLAPYLPDEFDLSTDIADYRWTRLRSRASPRGVESGMLRVRPKRDLRPVLIDKWANMANQALIVRTNNQVRF